MSGTLRTGTKLWTAGPTAAAASFPPITCCLQEQQTSGTRRPSGALNWGGAGGRRVQSCPNLPPLFRTCALSLSDPEAEAEPVTLLWPGARGLWSGPSRPVPLQRSEEPAGVLALQTLIADSWGTAPSGGAAHPRSHKLDAEVPFPISFCKVIQGLITSGPFFCAGLPPFPICTCSSEPCSNPASSRREPSPEPNYLPPFLL